MSAPTVVPQDMKPMAIAAVIPARFASSRFPGKPMALVAGLPMIVRVCERASAARLVDRVWVATDDLRIAGVVREAGYEARMTPADCPSGSDRVWASLQVKSTTTATTKEDIVVNVQGDEPFIEPAVIDATIEALLASPGCGVGTAAVPIRDRAEFESPHVVKVVLAEDGRAMYFSRSPLPSPARLSGPPADGVWGLKHLGLYAWRRPVLEQFAGWAPGVLEQKECLEQLRLLEKGIGIAVAVVEHDSIGVDTPEDLEKLNERMKVKTG